MALSAITYTELGKNLKAEKVEVQFCQCNQEAAMKTRKASIMQSKLVIIYVALLKETQQITEISRIRQTVTQLNTRRAKSQQLLQIVNDFKTLGKF